MSWRRSATRRSAPTRRQAADLHARMGCVDAQYRRCAAGAARASRPPQADSFGYHPHPLLNARTSRTRTPTRRSSPTPAAVPRARQAARAKRLRVSGTIHLTEFGYQTTPPDHAVGISLASRRASCSRRHTWPGSPSAVRGCPSTSGTTSRSVNRGGGSKRLFGLADRAAVQQRQAEARALDVPGPVRDRAQGTAKSVRLWGQVRPNADPTIVVQIRPKGAAGSPTSRP